jgi:hypothetical protein
MPNTVWGAKNLDHGDLRTKLRFSTTLTNKLAVATPFKPPFVLFYLPDTYLNGMLSSAELSIEFEE